MLSVKLCNAGRPDGRIRSESLPKKWLSYREHDTIERALNEQEVSHVQATTRRLATILLLGPQLDR